VYCSSNWCPPCRGFLEILKNFWKEVQTEIIDEKGKMLGSSPYGERFKNLEIMVISFDQSEE